MVILHAAVGTVLGFLSGIGVGGGSLLILWLTLALHVNQPQARIINLLFFIPCALICSFMRRKQGVLDIKKLIPGIIAGCVSAAIFSYIGRIIDVHILKKIFGILLIITGFHELRYRPAE